MENNPLNQPNIITEFFGWINDAMIAWTDPFWWWTMAGLFLVGSLFGMSPMQSHHEHRFHTLVLIKVRYLIVFAVLWLLLQPWIMIYLANMTDSPDAPSRTMEFLQWYWKQLKSYWHYVPVATLIGWSSRFFYSRYIVTFFSAILRMLRFSQTGEQLSDIRRELDRFNAKEFVPKQYYKNGQMFVGVNEGGKPNYVPDRVWYETNMQIIGPTRYGKGILIGNILDQSIRGGDMVIYVDPKHDRWAPYIMHKACEDAGRKFMYLTLHDEGFGKWAPFSGGSQRDALSRLYKAFDLEFDGNADTDYYKAQERSLVDKYFAQARGIKELHNYLQGSEANRLIAGLQEWKSIESLCPKNKAGFTVEKAMEENAVVYVQGSLYDPVVKMATKLLILEVIQETKRLQSLRKAHLTLIVDEVRFLVSKELADALATVVGFGANVVTAYQSIKDLLAPDDKSLNGDALLQSINVNSQIKVIYGGADSETAEWVADLSGNVQKFITKMEKTEVRASGGEIWESGRTVGIQEEQLITENLVKVLPPRVSVLFRPQSLATLNFTSPVPVRDTKVLDEWLERRMPRKQDTVLAAELEKALANPADNAPQKKEQAPAPKPKEDKPKQQQQNNGAQQKQGQNKQANQKPQHQQQKSQQHNKQKGQQQGGNKPKDKDKQQKGNPQHKQQKNQQRQNEQQKKKPHTPEIAVRDTSPLESGEDRPNALEADLRGASEISLQAQEGEGARKEHQHGLAHPNSAKAKRRQERAAKNKAHTNQQQADDTPTSSDD